MIENDKIEWIRNRLGKARNLCMKRGLYEGPVFELLWSIDDFIEDALNTLIDYEREIAIGGKSES